MEALQEKARSVDANVVTTASASSLHLVKRALLFRDSISFFVLMLATLILYAATSFMFRSFEERRADLARDYTAQGKKALAADRPNEAITAFRTALSYAPDDRTNHLLLAEALADAHHWDEATSYFLTLRETQPADGFINFELARLARQKGDRGAAIEYYRSSSLGTWNGDSMSSRRTVQMELADYLVQGGDLPAARAEILLAAADTPETVSLDMQFGDKLLEAQDTADALMFYRKAVALDEHSFEALSKAGRLLYRTGDYPAAHEFLERALRQEPRKPEDRAEVAQIQSLAEDAQRIQQLSLRMDLAPGELAAHLRTDANVARARLSACLARNGGSGALPAEWEALMSEWQVFGKVLDRGFATQSAADQDSLRELIFRTEQETSQECGSPTGDDALLLQLAQAYVAR